MSVKYNFSSTGLNIFEQKYITMRAVLGCIIILFLCCFNQSEGQIIKYDVQSHTDRNGYKYETVTNDPAGLRLYKLRNGLTVYLAQERSEPRINYATALRAGSANDPKDNTGLAHYLEHLLFNGTDSIGTLDWEKESSILNEVEEMYELLKQEKDPVLRVKIDKRIDSLSYKASEYGIKGEYRKLMADIGGVSVNGTTNFEYIVYGCIIPSPSLEKLLALEGSRFSNPAFRAFRTEMEIVYEEFNAMQDNEFIQKYFPANRELFKKHPYGQQIVIGTSEHLKNPSVRAIKEYYQKYYVPDNMAIILTGDIDFEKTIQLVDNEFGSYRPGNIQRPVFPKEDSIVVPTTVEITTPAPAAAFIGFRLNGVGTEDEKYITLVNQMLSNNVAGMLNLELTSSQKVKGASSFLFVNNDYSMHYINGNPKDGQMLSEVKDHLMSVLEKIKEGDFDDWLIQACAIELKRRFIKDIAEGRNLDAIFATAFTQFQSWSKRLAFYDEMQNVSKQQLVEFVKSAYKHNYVVVNKKQGPSTEMVKVSKPQVTPIMLNGNKSSVWAASFQKTKPAEIKPEFVDYSKAINHIHLPEGISIEHVPNLKSHLFQADIIFGAGKATDKKILLAVNYLNFVATSQYTLAGWRKEFYKLGLSFSFNVHEGHTVFHIEGMKDNLYQGIQLLSQIVNTLTPDPDTYDNYILSILNNRRTQLTSITSIRQAVVNFALFGEQSTFRDAYTQEELKNIDPRELTDLVRNLFSNYRFRAFYYGDELDKFTSALLKFFPTIAIRQNFPRANHFFIQPSKPVIYFVNYEGAQAQVDFLIRGQIFKIETMPLSNMFNRFVEKVYMNEIREVRSLAYSGFATHFISEDSANYDYMQLHARTQANKLNELLKTGKDILNDISAYENVFIDAKIDQLKRYQRERVKGVNIFWSLETFKKLGIQYDFRNNMYQAIQMMEFTDMLSFFKENISERDMTITIVADKKEIDMIELSKYGQVQELNTNYLFNYR